MENVLVTWAVPYTYTLQGMAFAPLWHWALHLPAPLLVISTPSPWCRQSPIWNGPPDHQTKPYLKILSDGCSPSTKSNPRWNIVYGHGLEKDSDTQSGKMISFLRIACLRNISSHLHHSELGANFLQQIPGKQPLKRNHISESRNVKKIGDKESFLWLAQ